MCSRSSRQTECVNNWVKAKCVGTIVAAVGFGKTRIGLQAIQRFHAKNPNKSVIIIVPSEPVKKQWEEELQNYCLDADVKTMYDTSRNKYSCSLLIIDEIHKISTPRLINSFNNVKYKIILGLTATFSRLDGREKLIEKHCPVIDTIPQEEAIKNHWLNEYKEYLILIEPQDIDQYIKLNKEFIEHFSYFDYNFSLALKLSTDWKYRTGYIKNNKLDKIATKTLMYHAMGFNRTLQGRKKYINNHPMKIDITNKILSYRQDKKCITFSSTIAMAEKISYGEVYSGKDSKKKGRTTLEEFSKKSSGVVNTCMKLNEGFNDPSISVAIILGMNSSKTIKTQRKGRILRVLEGKEAEIFNIVIKNTVEEQWFKNSVGSGNYITLDEDGLDKLLNNQEVTIKKNKETNMLFRF